MDIERHYHRIYAEIVKLITQTYLIALSTNSEYKIETRKLIGNLFRNYIKLQKVSLRLNEKKAVLEGTLTLAIFLQMKIMFTRYIWIQ